MDDTNKTPLQIALQALDDIALAGKAVARREALIEEAFQRAFAGYNTPRDRYPDDFSYSVFQGKCLSDAMSLLQRVTGRARWANDNCPATASASASGASEEAIQRGVAILKTLQHHRVPPYELPADSFLAEAVRDILSYNPTSQPQV